MLSKLHHPLTNLQEISVTLLKTFIDEIIKIIS